MNSTLTELRQALERSGLPLNNVSAMQDVMPSVKNRLFQSSRQNDPYIQKKRDEYMNKISQIAEMDKRLAGVYSNPSSDLYIENPMSRESILSGAENYGYRSAQPLLSEISQRESEIENEASMASSLYSSMADELEKQNKKAASAGYDTDAILRDLFADEGETTDDYTEIDNVLKELGL